MSRWNSAPIVLLAVISMWPHASRAQEEASAPSPEQVEAARGPFREARELQRQGKPAEALAKMLEAYRIASTPVLGLELGRLYGQVGRLIEGRDLLRSVGSLPVSPRESEAGREARRQAAELAMQLDLRIAKIVVVGRGPGLDVTLDGRALADASDAIPVDPGAHSVVVRAGDRGCKTLAMVLAFGEARVINLADASRACAVTGAPAEREGDRDGAGDPVAWRWAGGLLAGAGLVAIGSGVYLVLHAKGDYESASSECTARGCTQAGYDIRHSAHARADAATVITSIGAAAIAGGGAIWFLLGKRHDAAAVNVGLGPSAAYLRVAIP